MSFLVLHHLKKEEKLVDLLLLSYKCTCIVAVNVIWLFLIVPLVALQCVNVVFPGHTHLLFHDLSTVSVSDGLH